MLSIQEVLSVIKKDYARYTDDMMSFIAKNQVQYYIACNTWLYCIKEYCPWTAEDMKLSIKQKGLFYNISLCSDLAQDLIVEAHASGQLSPKVGTFADSMCQELISRGMPPMLTTNEVGKSIFPTVLFLLRYLKRFSPLLTPKLADASIMSFFTCENKNKMRQRREYSPFLITLLKEEVSRLIDEDAIIREWEQDYSQSPELFKLTPGVTKDSDGTVLGKLRAIARTNPEAFYMPFGLPLVCFTDETQLEDRSVKITAVPKNYKAARIIAPEPTYRQARARVLFDVIDRHSYGFDIHDQSINSDLAAIGARTGTYSTVDLSHASDTITKTLVRQVFPARLVSLLMAHTGEYCEYNNKRRPMETFSTAGNALTFIVETIIFTALARVAEYQARLFIGCSMKTALSYGDDIIIPTYAYATLTDMLRSLGFEMNEAKSFSSDGPGYREACGEEFFCSERLTHPYFPRFAIEGLIQGGRVKLSRETRRNSKENTYFDSTTSCLSLQGALFSIAPQASRWLSNIIVDNHPLMTKSSWRECDITDLRSIIDTWGDPQSIPLGMIIHTPGRFVSSPRVTKLKRYTDPDITRPTKYSSTCVYDDVKLGRDSILIDLFRYTQYLWLGPDYSDDISVIFSDNATVFLNEILRVSTPRVSGDRLGKPRLSWRLTS